MEDNSITPNQSSVHDPNSLEASAQSQSVADLAGLQKDYPIETLEVRSEGDKSPVAKKVEYVPTVRSVPFSKRKAVLISLGITLVVVVLTGVSLGYLVRENAMDKNSVERNIPTQGVSVGKSEVGASLPQFNSDQPSLLVDGDIITRGELKVSSGNFMTVIRNQNATADQVINIPASSGELCLSANNCSFATIGDLAAVQGSIVAPTTLNSQDGEVTIQGASNRINVTTNGSVITITTPQALNTAANVQFSSLTLSSQLKVNSISVNSGDLMVSAANGSVRFIDGDRTFRFPSGGLADQTICTTQNNCNYGTGNGDIVNGGQIGPIIIGTNDASSLSFYTNAVNRLDLSSNGNLSVATDTFYVDAVNKRVGIGTAAPASIFEVHSTSTTPNFMTFRSSSVGYAGAMMVLESDTAARARGVFFTEGTKGANGAWFVGSGYTSSDFMIGNSPTHTTVNGNGAYNLGNAALIVKAQSKLIGIGTNNPDARLHVSSVSPSNRGLIIQAAASQTANLQEWQSSTGTILASVNATGVGSFANLLQNGNQVCDNTNNCSYAPSTGGAGYIQNQTAVSQAAGFNISGNGTIGGNLAVNTNTLFVDAVSGRVGVGTAAPDYALHVVGNSNIVGDLQVGTNALPVGTCQVIAATVPCKQGLRVGTSSVETNQNTTGIHNVVNIAAPSANTATNRGLSSSLNLTGSTTYNSGVAGLFTATANSGAAVSSLAGIGVDVYAANTGSATNGVGININIGNLLAGGTIQNATGININTFTNNGAIETAMGMVINGQTAGSSHNVGLAINESSTASLLLTSLTGSSSSGITFGYPGLEIVNLYRSDIGTLQLDGNFNVRDRLVVGTAPGFSIGSIPESGLVNVKEFTTQTLGTGLTNLVTVNNSVSNGTYVGQSGVTSTDPTSLNNLFILLGSQNFVNHQGGGNIIGSLTGQSIMLSNSGSGNVASTVGLAISGLTNAGGGSVTNNYGIQVQAQSAGLNNYGIAIGNASTQTLWLQGDGGTANTGIGFGSTRDTNIYRSETGVLKTDGKLIIGDNNQPLFFGGYYGGGSIETPSFVVNATTSSLDYTAGSYTQLNLNPSSASAGGVGGVISITSDSASIGDINELVGGIIGAGHFGSGVAHQAIGQQTGLINGGTGVIDDATGLYVAVQNASTGSITSSSGLHISAVDATSDAYGIRINDVTSATNSYGIAVGEASTQTLWLQGDGGTANTGIGFGSARDTNLYRSAAGVLKTDNRLEVVDRGTFGNNITALEGSFTASLVANRTVNTPSVSEASSISQINFNPTTSPGLVGGYAHISTAATVQTSTESVSVTAGSLSRFVHKGSGGVGVAAGLDARVMLQGTGNISQAAGIRASVQDTGAGSVNLGIGLAVGSVQAASDAYGVLISPLSSATNNYGIAVGEASTQTLWLQGDGGTANTGIGFGSARDTNLYRSAAGVLRTDGNLIVGSEMLVVGAVNLGAELTVAGDVTLGGNLEVVNATVNGVLMVNGNLTLNGHVISGNTSGSTTIAAGSGAECSAAAVVTIDGNDTAGTVEVTTGGGACSPGELVSVIFANTYGSAPKITITPANAAAAGLQYYAGSATTSSLTIDTANAPSPSTSYSYNYQVIE